MEQEQARPPDQNLLALELTDQAWLIEHGYADIFLARLRADQTFGVRTYLFRVDTAGAIFSVGPENIPSGWKLYARLSQEGKAVASHRQYLGDPVTHIERWVSSLVTHALPDVREPKIYQALAGDERVDTQALPITVSSSAGLTWLHEVRGNLKLLGSRPLEIGQDEAYPLTRPAWVTLDQYSHLRGISTAQACASGVAWHGLDHLHKDIVGIYIENILADQDEDRQRLIQRNRADAAKFQSAILNLAAPLDEQGARGSPSQANSLLLACSQVGRLLGIDFVAPPSDAAPEDPRRQIGAICRVSHVRSRKVVLQGQWFREDGQPMVALLSTGKAIALLPRGSRGYDFFDPETGQRQPLSAELISELEPFAYVFYRPFAPGAVTLRSLVKFALRGAGRDIGVILLMATAVGLLGLIGPALIGIVFDSIIPGAQRSLMIETAALLLAATISAALITMSRGFSLLRLEGKIEYAVQAAIFDRLLALPPKFFRQFAAGELAQRAAVISEIRRMLTGSAMTALLSGVFSSFNLALLFWYNSVLGFTALGLTFIEVLFLIAVGVWYLRNQNALVAKEAKASGLMLQLFGGITKIRVAAAEKRAFMAWSSSATEIWRLTLKGGMTGNLLTVFNSAFPLLSSVCIFLVVSTLLEDPQRSNFSTGQYIAASAAFGSFSAAMMQLAQVALGLLAIVPNYRIAKPILEATPEVDYAKPPIGELSGRIELNQVSFRYSEEGPPILEDVTLEIRPGEFVAFVGTSGAGKSTVMRLLLGFEKPFAGGVFIDGQDIFSFDIASIRSQIGVVLQNSTLFQGDIFENIVCSGPYSLDDAWEAARIADIEKDIRAMPMGMHTIVGDGGAGLSGGQRQRLMIARAVVGRPRLLLFDEATSALDNQTQAVVSRSLESMRATRVVIAHRLSTVIKADRIYVMEKGRIVQQGNYEQLIAAPGPFATLAQRQLI